MIEIRRAAFVLVHYHGADLLPRAIAAIEADCASCAVAPEFVVVDNGSTDAEKAVLRELPGQVLEDPSNGGYATAINRGVAASDAPFVFLMNPDVFLLPGCTEALLRALETGSAAAGPQFYWDDDRRFLMPPTERRTVADELAAAMAERGDWAATRARARWRRHARRHWSAREPFESIHLSGALIAVRRDAFERVGPFDEGFRLYFEEQDWLVRAAEAGVVCSYVPAAEAVHFFNQSAVSEPQSRVWEAESAKRYAAKHLPGWLPRAVETVRPARSGLSEPARIETFPPTLDLPRRRERLWIEISPAMRGFPAGATRVASDEGDRWTLPESVWAHMAPGRYYATVCADDGRELQRASFERPEIVASGM